MYAPTANGTALARFRAQPKITTRRPNVATNSLPTWASPARSCRDAKNNARSPNIACCNATATPDERTGDLREHVTGYLTPSDAAAARFGERDDGIHVRAGNSAEREDERDEPRARGDRIHESSTIACSIFSGQTLTHDAGANHDREQERGRKKFGDELPQQHPVFFAAVVEASLFVSVLGAQHADAPFAASSCMASVSPLHDEDSPIHVAIGIFSTHTLSWSA